MTRTILLVPPDKEGFVRDTYYGCWHRRKFVEYSWPPLMLYYLHALLPDSVVVDAPANKLDAESTIRKLASLDADVVVTSVGTFTVEEDGPFLQRLKQDLGCTTAVFGNLAATDPAAVRQMADLVLKGEPESAMKRLGTALAGKKGILDGGLVQDLDTLPFPRRVLKDRELYFNPFARRGPFTTMLASRGCPSDCIFCPVPVMYGKSFRTRSVKNVLGELAMLSEQGFREVMFRDENLTLNKRFVTVLCRGIIESGIDITWSSNSRVDTVDEQLLGLMHEAGCHLLKFGVESFSDKTLERLRKGTRARDAHTAFSLCKKIGIDTVAHMMLGSPGEDERQMVRNIEEVLRINPTYASFDVVLTYPGTHLAEMERQGKTTDVPRERLEFLHDSAFRRFYLRPRIIWRHLLKLSSPGELHRKTRATVQLWRSLFCKG